MITPQEQNAFTVVQAAVQLRDKELDATKAELQTEKAAHVKTRDALRIATNTAADLQKRIDAMADHPDVKAAALKRARDNFQRAKDALASAEAKDAPTPKPETQPEPKPEAKP